ncbi:MAG: transporter substrate-binding domain-containing protein [Pseudomonadota bacterium]
MKFFITTLAACLLSIPMHVGATAHKIEPIHVVTSELPPLVMEGRPASPAGALYDMVDEIARRTGTPLIVEFVPWKRALFVSGTRTRTAVFPLTRNPERERQYRWLVRLYHEHFVFIARAGGRFDTRHPARSKQRKVAILRGSAMMKDLQARGYKHIVEAATVAESVRYLTSGMVDAVFGDEAIMRTMLKGHPESGFAFSGPINSTTTWLGGSLDFGPAEEARLQKAMRDMVADGSYATILKKYQLSQ